MAIKEWTSNLATTGQPDSVASMPNLVNGVDDTRVSQVHALRDSLIALQSGGGGGVLRSIPALTGVRGFWKLDGDLVDSSGNGLDLSLIAGSERYCGIGGRKAFNFSYPTTLGRLAPDALLQSTGAFSAVVRIMAENSTGFIQTLLEYAGTTSGPADQQANYMVGFYDTGQPFGYCENTPDFGDPAEPPNGAIVTSGYPHILVVTRSASLDWNIYSDGDPLSAPLPETFGCSGGSAGVFTVGHTRNPGAGNGFTGIMWDVQIYQRELTPAEVLYLAVQGGHRHA